MTLLKALAARRVGEVPANIAVHYVGQEVSLPPAQRGKTPVQCMVDADLEHALLLEELRGLARSANAGDLDANGSRRHADITSRLGEIGANSAGQRAAAPLDLLGFGPELRDRPLAQQSGGWQVRAMLVDALFARSNLLLLDKLTNHLLILAVTWLAQEFTTSKVCKRRIVVIISHNRCFLDEICTDCLHVSGSSRRLTQSRGNYSLWSKLKRNEQALFEREQARREAEINALHKYAGHRFKYGGSS